MIEKFPFRLVKKKQILRFFSKMRIINLSPIISFDKFVLKDMFHRKYECMCVCTHVLHNLVFVRQREDLQRNRFWINQLAL